MKIKFLNSKLSEPQRFEYRPRYYDERKERLEKKKAMYRRADDGTLTEEERRAMLKDSMRENWTRGHHRQNQVRWANMRVLLLVGLILVLGYFIFFGLESVDKIVENIF
jgi:hypothetical protein